MAHLCNLGLLIIPAVFLYFQFAICTGVFLGEQCTKNANCTANVSNSECVNNHTCQCSATFYKQNSTCQEKKALGYPCKADVECSDDNAICRTNCTCKPSHYKDNNKVCQQRVPLGGSCAMHTSCKANVSYSECKNGTCQCAATYFQENKTCQSKIPLGGPCAMNTSCIANVSNSECKNSICHCAATFYQENKTCNAKKTLGYPCNADVECSDVNAICRTNCTCKPSHYKDNNTVCQQRIHPNMTCDSSDPEDTSCVANAFCNRTHVCVCRIGYKATKTSCNSAMTIAKLDISTIIMCFILACLGVLT